jgi:serine/threonine protein kinase
MWKIPTSRGFCNFEIERCIGYGGFSRVYMARRLSDGGFCALKVIDKKLVQQENRIDMVRNEDEIMRTLNHPFVVSMQGSFETSRHVVFILECTTGVI